MQLILVFAAAIVGGPFMPTLAKSACLALSLSILDILLFTMPFIVFICLFYSLVANKGHAVRFAVILLLTVCLSNFISLMAAYGLGAATLSNLALSSETLNHLAKLEPLWALGLPELIETKYALLLGFIVGIFFSFVPSSIPLKIGKKLNRIVTLFLSKFFIPVLPLFSFGFILKMQHEGLLTHVLLKYAPIYAIVFFGTLIYVLLMFMVAAKFHFKTFLEYIKNVIPAGILGFTTLSSLAVMPVTLRAAEKNTNDPTLARAAIPATVNIHMIGDSITTPIVILATMLTFGLPFPSFIQFLLFTQFYMIAKFGIPGVPCGCIFVLMPILISMFGFTEDMSAFITAIYILFDSVVTGGNVLGNSALAIILSRLMKWMPTKREAQVAMTPLSVAPQADSE